MNDLRLMCVLAHPDDESMGNGGILAKYAAEGVSTALICATRGQRGWPGPPQDNPGPDALGRIREGELRDATRVLGVHRLEILDYVDGDLDQAPGDVVISQIVRIIREVRPHVVATFAADGAYGHPDHIAISQWTSAACVAAADADYEPTGSPLPHRVAKLYQMVVSQRLADAYTEAIGGIAIDVDDDTRSVVIWPDWAITTRIDCDAHWRTVWQAIRCHTSQLPDVERMDRLPEELLSTICGSQEYYRVYSLVNSGRTVETDLFEGLR